MDQGSVVREAHTLSLLKTNAITGREAAKQTTKWRANHRTPLSTTRLLYDRKEAARQLSISVRSVDYLIAGRQLETRRIGKKVLITHASLVRYSQGNHYDSPRELGIAA